jgi:hypothetical protein
MLMGSQTPLRSGVTQAQLFSSFCDEVSYVAQAGLELLYPSSASASGIAGM